MRAVASFLVLLGCSLLAGCGGSATDTSASFDPDKFAEVAPEMTEAEVFALLGDPLSRDYRRIDSDDGIVRYGEGWTPESGLPRVWRYSRPSREGRRFHVYQVVFDPDRGRVMAADSYLSVPPAP